MAGGVGWVVRSISAVGSISHGPPHAWAESRCGVHLLALGAKHDSSVRGPPRPRAPVCLLGWLLGKEEGGCGEWLAVRVDLLFGKDMAKTKIIASSQLKPPNGKIATSAAAASSSFFCCPRFDRSKAKAKQSKAKQGAHVQTHTHAQFQGRLNPLSPPSRRPPPSNRPAQRPPNTTLPLLFSPDQEKVSWRHSRRRPPP